MEVFFCEKCKGAFSEIQPDYKNPLTLCKSCYSDDEKKYSDDEKKPLYFKCDTCGVYLDGYAFPVCEKCYWKEKKQPSFPKDSTDCYQCGALTNNKEKCDYCLIGITFYKENITNSKPSYYDKINSPSHYTHGGIEAIDYMKAKLTAEEFKGYLKGNIIKYSSRASLKGEELEDYKKCAWYLNRLIQEAGDKK